MISGYRANNGLPAVTLDPELMQLAQAQADADGKARQARSRRRQAVRDAAQSDRATTPRSPPKTSAPAITRWPKHSPAGAIYRRTAPTCCSAGATRIGIAAVYTPRSKYKVYWALILADAGRSAGADRWTVTVRAGHKVAAMPGLLPSAVALRHGLSTIPLGYPAALQYRRRLLRQMGGERTGPPRHPACEAGRR